VKRSIREKEPLLPTKRIFVTVALTNTGHFLHGVERAKRFVNVHLHFQQPEKDKKYRRCNPWKNICGRPCVPMKGSYFSVVLHLLGKMCMNGHNGF